MISNYQAEDSFSVKIVCKQTHCMHVRLKKMNCLDYTERLCLWKTKCYYLYTCSLIRNWTIRTRIHMNKFNYRLMVRDIELHSANGPYAWLVFSSISSLGVTSS